LPWKWKKLDDLTAYVNSELKKVANWFRSNKMAVNTSKTKFIVFRTRGKRIDPRECKLLFNINEIGKTEDPNRILKSNGYTMKVMKKVIKLLEFYWTSTYHLMNIFHICVPKYQSPSIVSIG
jgi:hypothetical protein